MLAAIDNGMDAFASCLCRIAAKSAIKAYQTAETSTTDVPPT